MPFGEFRGCAYNFGRKERFCVSQKHKQMCIRAGAGFAPAFAPVAVECATVRDVVLMHSTLLFDVLALVRSQYTGDRTPVLLGILNVCVSALQWFVSYHESIVPLGTHLHHLCALVDACTYMFKNGCCSLKRTSRYKHPKAEVLE